MTEGIANSMKSGLQANMIVMIVLQLVFSQFLKNVWPLFNVIQLIIVLAIMPVDLPTNGHMVFK